MQFNSLTDKFHYILLTGEIYDMELGVATSIVNALLNKVSTEKKSCILYSQI